MMEQYLRCQGRDERLSPTKLHVSQYVVALVLAVLLPGLWRLQVLGANGYRVLAEQNRVRKVPVLAPRGRIFDRDGRILVDNYPSVSCNLLREEHGMQVKNLEADLPAIAAGLHMSLEQIQYTLRHYQSMPKYQPIPLKQDITADEQAFIEAHRNEFPELETQEVQRRQYPKDGFAAHLIGYVGEISENDLLNDSRYSMYQPGDLVGKSGVEQTYDAILRGQDGSRDVVVDSHGKEVGNLGQQEIAVPGQDLRLTIDLDVQRAAEQAMAPVKAGALVAMDPHTGEVLAMVSRPTFDPNAFSVRISRADWANLMNNPDHPLLNKTIQAQLAPGSTFKIIMSLAGLEENTAQTLRVNCQGGGVFYGQFHACDKHHGMVDIEHAIPWSCDTFYYTLAEKLGIDTIAKYGNEVGIGVKTGIDLPDEAQGIMPSTLWKLKTQHQPWYPGEVISVGIGQGAVTVTPLQLARALSGIASGGALKRPHVVFSNEIPAEEAVYRSRRTSRARAIRPFRSRPRTGRSTRMRWRRRRSAGTAGAVCPAMQRPSPRHTGGKTGTAQVMSHEALARSGGGHKTVPNSWFVGMAPRRNPDIVVAVLWENGDWGENSASLVAQVINTYVTKHRKEENNLRVVSTPQPAKPAGIGATVPGAE